MGLLQVVHIQILFDGIPLTPRPQQTHTTAVNILRMDTWKGTLFSAG